MKTMIVAGAKSRTEEMWHIRQVLKHGYNEVLIIRCREIALEYLPPAVIAKVPPPYFSDVARAKYAAIGRSLKWNLTIDGDKGATGDYAFFFAARDAGLSPSQQNASTLLYATLEALEAKALSDRVRQNIDDAYCGLDFDVVMQGDGHSKRQSEKAKLPRGIIPEIKEKLVSQYPDHTAKELWPHLYAELEERDLDPEENDDAPGGEWYTYDHKDGRKTIKFTTFANIKTMNKSR